MPTFDKRVGNNGKVTWRVRVRRQGGPPLTKTFAKKSDGETIASAKSSYKARDCPPAVAEKIIDTDRKEGLKNEVKGAAKEIAGKVTGNKLREAEGNVQKHVGKIQNEAGKAADKARDEVKKSLANVLCTGRPAMGGRFHAAIRYS